MTKMTTRVSRLLLAAVAAAGLAANITQAASAHAELLRATPAADAVVTEPPKNVVLQFGEDILTMASNVISVIGPDGSTADNDNTLVQGDTAAVGLINVVAAGNYTVTYRIASADGHVITDSYTFQYEPAPDAAVSSGSDGTGAVGNGAPSASADDVSTTVAEASVGKKPTIVSKIFFLVVFGGALWWASRALRAYRRKALERHPD